MQRTPHVLVLLLALAGWLAQGAAAGGPAPPSVAAPADSIAASGIVVDEAGDAVSAARVLVVDRGRVLSATTTDRSGGFEIRVGGDGVDVPLLRVERMGYATRDLPLDRRVTHGLRIELVRTPLPLPGLEVVGRGAECVAPDDPAPRTLWRAAVERHRLDLDTLGIASYTLAGVDTLDAGHPWTAGAERDELVPGQRSSAPLLRFSWERRVQRQGYAFPVRRTSRNGSYDSWSYAPLEADFAQHFLSESFAERHHFRDLDIDARGGFDLHFCPVDSGRPALRGRLSFTPDTILVRAEWDFVTPDPDERAGGWSAFAGVPEAGGARLLPTESLTWRGLPDGRVQRRSQLYEGWVLAPGDSVPFLPGR